MDEQKNKFIASLKDKYTRFLQSKLVLFVKANKRLSLLLTVLIVLSATVTIMLLKLYPPHKYIQQKQTPLASPSPRPIAHGPQTFTVSQSDKTVPQLGKGLLDPYDPALKSNQSVTIAVKNSSPITKVTAETITDHKTSGPHPFTLIDGTNTDGTWKGTWKVDDEYLYTYKLILIAESQDGKIGRVEMTLR